MYGRSLNLIFVRARLYLETNRSLGAGRWAQRNIKKSQQIAPTRGPSFTRLSASDARREEEREHVVGGPLQRCADKTTTNKQKARGEQKTQKNKRGRSLKLINSSLVRLIMQQQQ